MQDQRMKFCFVVNTVYFYLTSDAKVLTILTEFIVSNALSTVCRQEWLHCLKRCMATDIPTGYLISTKRRDHLGHEQFEMSLRPARR
jgi:hypothetical protein